MGARGIRSPGAELKVTDDCEPPDLGSGSQTQASVRVLCVFNHGVISPAPL